MRLTAWRTAGPLKNLHTRTYFLNQSRSDLTCRILPFKARFGSKTWFLTVLDPVFGPF